MKVLVYDNEIGYFDFLIDAVSRKSEVVEFVKYNNLGRAEFDMLVFFLHSQLELLDFFKLYKKDMPVIFASSLPHHDQQLNDHIAKENMYYLDLNCHRNKLATNINNIFNKIQS